MPTLYQPLRCRGCGQTLGRLYRADGIASFSMRCHRCGAITMFSLAKGTLEPGVLVTPPKERAGRVRAAQLGTSRAKETKLLVDPAEAQATLRVDTAAN